MITPLHRYRSVSHRHRADSAMVETGSSGLRVVSARAPRAGHPPWSLGHYRQNPDKRTRYWLRHAAVDPPAAVHPPRPAGPRPRPRPAARTATPPGPADPPAV